MCQNWNAAFVMRDAHPFLLFDPASCPKSPLRALGWALLHLYLYDVHQSSYSYPSLSFPFSFLHISPKLAKSGFSSINHTLSIMRLSYLFFAFLAVLQTISAECACSASSGVQPPVAVFSGLVRRGPCNEDCAAADAAISVRFPLPIPFPLCRSSPMMCTTAKLRRNWSSASTLRRTSS